jgi:uncharacterized cysteine cluster protein YcgN (CxxCxxCC family)
LRNRGIIQKPGRRRRRSPDEPARQGARPFWETKSLSEMTPAEWESLCDGCGNCCLHKLRNDDTGELFRTSVACRLLDGHSCRCRSYVDRRRLVPDCTVLTPERVAQFDWLPSTCAYRLVSAGKPLAWWHPLVSGDPETVHRAGISVRGRTVSETEIGDTALESYIIDD